MDRNANRNRLIVNDYLAGSTLREVGQRHQLTHERIRQILRAAGVNYAHSMRRWRTANRRAAKLQQVEPLYQTRFGCSRAEYRALRTAENTRIYSRFKANNKHKGFALSFPDWWRLWQESGHWAERGRGRGYWMARIDRSKPITADNVVIRSGAGKRT